MFEITFEATAPTPTPDASAFVVAREGESLLKALQRANTPIISVCGGQASCGACRVEIDPDWFARLPAASRTEQALLEFLDDPAPTHRLACQVAATTDLAGLRLALAPSF